MNLVQFIKVVDESCAELSAEELRGLIHELARIQMESERDKFMAAVKSVKTSKEPPTSPSPKKSVKNRDHKKLMAQLSDIEEKLEEINDGLLEIRSEYNEAWDDWYGSSDDEYVYYDDDGVGEIISDAMSLVHEFSDREMYKEAYFLAEKLSKVEVMDSDGYGEDMGFDDLAYNDIIPHDTKSFYTEALYSAYMGNLPKERPQAFYSLVVNFNININDVSLEDVMQAGDGDLPGLGVFVKDWLCELCNRALSNGHLESPWLMKYILEAFDMLESNDERLEFARKYAADWPVLFSVLLERGIEAPEESKWFLDVGLEALDLVPIKNAERSDIALLTSQFAWQLSDLDTSAACRVEALRSHVSLENFLRIRLFDGDWAKRSKEIRSIYELRRGIRDFDSVYDKILFFDGRLDEVLEHGLDIKEGLGWSSTFAKTGVSLFLCAIGGGHISAHLKSELLDFARAVSRFNVTEFLKGLDAKFIDAYFGSDLSDGNVFATAFDMWLLSASGAWTKDDKKKWLEHIERLIDMRVDGIMGAGRTNYYHECALYVAALGEAKEALCEKGALLKTLRKYKERHSRKRNFVAELREFGLD